jgi:hypothetical protein
MSEDFRSWILANTPRGKASGVLTPLELQIMQVLWDGWAPTSPTPLSRPC